MIVGPAKKKAISGLLAGAISMSVVATFSASPLQLVSFAGRDDCTSNILPGNIRLKELSEACIEVSVEDGGGAGEVCVPRGLQGRCSTWALERCGSQRELRLSRRCGSSLYQSLLTEDGTRRDDDWGRRFVRFVPQHPLRASLSFAGGLMFYLVVIAIRRLRRFKKEQAR